MLEDLQIKNFALIDSLNIEFNSGFTVLTGETGAGKSVFIGAISFLLGGKASIDQIRSGASEASVSGTFLLPAESSLDKIECKQNENGEIFANTARQWLKLHDIEPEENRVIIRRVIKDTAKTSAWICGVPVTRVDLQSFCLFLADIHGQHEHQSLMKVSEHRRFLDSYAGITDRVFAFREMYSLLVEKRKKLESICSNDKEKSQKIELLNFATKEIEDAKLKKDEDVTLEQELSKLSSFEKLYSEIELMNNIFSSDSDLTLVEAAKKLKTSSSKAFTLDTTLKEINSRIESLYYEINDLSEEVKNYSRTLVFDPERLKEVQDRLSLIYNLKKKYASSLNASLQEVFDYYTNSISELSNLQNASVSIESLTQEISQLEKEVYIEAKSISKIRVEKSEIMSRTVEEILSTLGMKGTTFKVSILEKPGTELLQKCGPFGLDNIEFLMSANPGNPLLPLAKIASGGELSRVMLALKTVFANNDSVPMMVFDEIDTGIGGEVAVSVGSHIKNLAKNRQIFCITHLASIAVYADNHIKISKGVTDDKTNTYITPIDDSTKVQEIARMLSGDSSSEQSLEHARAMLQKYS